MGQLTFDPMGREARLVPMPVIPGYERLYVFGLVNRQMLDDPELRATVAEAQAEMVADKVRQTILSWGLRAVGE
jgi:hypothetical protein